MTGILLYGLLSGPSLVQVLPLPLNDQYSFAMWYSYQYFRSLLDHLKQRCLPAILLNEGFLMSSWLLMRHFDLDCSLCFLTSPCVRRTVVVFKRSYHWPWTRTAWRTGMHRDAWMQEKALNFSLCQLLLTRIPHHIIPNRAWCDTGILAGVCRWQMPVECQPVTTIIFQPFLPWYRPHQPCQTYLPV